jgi:hypothetical protein
VNIEDKTGQMRSPEDFREAAKIVMQRMVKFPPDDIPLYMQFTTILEALRIAAAVATARGTK